ncbi:ROK family transcriptional regulator [Catenuloplanes atrovinosus]|uniref:NBD/HSP70 family sugar kinase n=1 Tax=Catenuloplanes atrovinosus TaxID=137266 RepID=A0AAE4C913_9ACTN|nr:ROK family transcriptional regulator [Catenuloplanes atrovinosus]MDR7274349.1 putative NBD/HSP70 family sugar kinase [Catenuloplanes atrovinosus]
MSTTSRGSGPHVLRRLNASAVLTALRTGGPQRVADLMDRTGLTRPTVTQALTLLERAGWISPVHGTADVTAAPRKGRPAQLVSFRAGAGCLVGADVGPHKAIVMITDLIGAPLAELRVSTGSAGDGPELITLIADTVRAALARAGRTEDEVYAVCIGSPGIADPENRTFRLAPSIPGWASLPLDAELGRMFRCPVLVENDVNLSVLAERWQGVATDAATVLFVHWGSRIGAGLVVGGRLHRGVGGAAGEIGFIDLDETPPVVGGMGPLERVVGADAIGRLGGGAFPDSGAVLRAAADGDPAALTAIDEIAARFARGLAPALLVLDPELVVIGGGVSRGGPPLLAALERHLRPRTLVPPRLALSALGDRAGVLGAIRACLDNLEATLAASL